MRIYANILKFGIYLEQFRLRLKNKTVQKILSESNLNIHIINVE